MELDLVIRNGNVVTATEEVFCDIGIAKGRIAALGKRLEGRARSLDAEGSYVFPGGVDAHCHIEQRSSSGLTCADDFYSGTVSAAFGGTTTVVPFAAQHRGDSVRQVVADYHSRAKAGERPSRTTPVVASVRAWRVSRSETNELEPALHDPHEVAVVDEHAVVRQ